MRSRIPNFGDRGRVLHQRVDVRLCPFGMEFGAAGHIFGRVRIPR